MKIIVYNSKNGDEYFKASTPADEMNVYKHLFNRFYKDGFYGKDDEIYWYKRSKEVTKKLSEMTMEDIKNCILSRSAAGYEYETISFDNLVEL